MNNTSDRGRFTSEPGDDRITPPASNVCTCGHHRADHIHGGGACRPNIACPKACNRFKAAPATNRKATE